MGIFLKEHITYSLTLTDDNSFVETNRKEYVLTEKIQPRKFKTERGKDYYCFCCKISDKKAELNSNYFVGIDWLTENRFICIEPKLNTTVVHSFEDAVRGENEWISDDEILKQDQSAEINVRQGDSSQEVDIIAMLMETMSHPETARHTGQLLLIDWNAPEISITQKQDILTPFLIVKFLKLLQDITRKGLKKSYYKVQEDLRSKVKGKVLIGQQIKQNVYKNRFVNTVCEYQVFGEDTIENRFLKKVFLFCTQYVENKAYYFKNKNDISWIINYIRPALEQISPEVNLQELKHLKYNPFFKEYKEAIKIGQHILKRFSYNITKTTAEKISTPPFWIDMPKLFELFVYARLLKDNAHLSVQNFNYQLSTYGNVLDFLICDEDSDTKIVVDAKYKLHYNYGQIHNDIRQVAGYARLKKIKEKDPQISEETACLIIYPKPIVDNNENKASLKIDSLLRSEKIKAYHEVYKLGIDLPVIN